MGGTKFAKPGKWENQSSVDYWPVAGKIGHLFLPRCCGDPKGQRLNFPPKNKAPPVWPPEQPHPPGQLGGLAAAGKASSPVVATRLRLQGFFAGSTSSLI
jgi:hypothetical protein